MTIGFDYEECLLENLFSNCEHVLFQNSFFLLFKKQEKLIQCKKC